MSQEHPLISALVAALAQPVPVTDGAMAVPENYNLHSLEEFEPAPNRIRATVEAVGIDSFTSYINRFKNPDSTIFITPDLTQLAHGACLATAVIDYHASGTAEFLERPRWGDHVVTLYARPSLPYAKLLALDGKLLDQPSFAQALEDIARFSSSHPAADLIEVARTISLTSKGDFKSFEDELSGSVDFKFDLAVRASAGTQTRSLTVPSVIAFNIPLIEGLSPVTVEAKFLYRVPDGPGGKVSLGIKIVDRVWLEDAAIREAHTKIAELTSLPVYVGKFHDDNKDL